MFFLFVIDRKKIFLNLLKKKCNDTADNVDMFPLKEIAKVAFGHISEDSVKPQVTPDTYHSSVAEVGFPSHPPPYSLQPSKIFGNIRKDPSCC